MSPTMRQIIHTVLHSKFFSLLLDIYLSTVLTYQLKVTARRSEKKVLTPNRHICHQWVVSKLR